jgi:hypothetical protein
MNHRSGGRRVFQLSKIRRPISFDFQIFFNGPSLVVWTATAIKDGEIVNHKTVGPLYTQFSPLWRPERATDL